MEKDMNQYESFLDNARLERAKERAAKEELIAAVALYEVLLGNYELQPDNHSSKALKDFLKKWPNIASYDSRGNYVGRVSLENGWTA
jgi:hypothetical protein